MTRRPFVALLNSRKFWLLVFGLTQTLLFHFLPQFPDVIWQAIDALVVFVIGSIALEDAAQKFQANRKS